MYKMEAGFDTYLKRPTHEPETSYQQEVPQVAKKPFSLMQFDQIVT